MTFVTLVQKNFFVFLSVVYGQFVSGCSAMIANLQQRKFYITAFIKFNEIIINAMKINSAL